jgi:hypothetical protein
VNLSEAEKSFDYFANLLKMQSSLLSLAVDWEAKSASTEMAPQAREGRNQALIDLKETRKNSLVLSILVGKAMAKEAERLVSVPMELAKVIRASTRLAQAGQQADFLIEQQEKKLAEDSKPEQESPTAMAIRKYLEKHDRGQSERRGRSSSELDN